MNECIKQHRDSLHHFFDELVVRAAPHHTQLSAAHTPALSKFPRTSTTSRATRY